MGVQRVGRVLLAVALVAMAVGCGSGGGSATDVAAVTDVRDATGVDQGPADVPEADTGLPDTAMLDGTGLDAAVEVAEDVAPDVVEPWSLERLVAETPALAEVCGEREPAGTLSELTMAVGELPVAGALRDMRAGDFEGVHMLTAHPLLVRKVRMYIAHSKPEPGRVELNVFNDYGRSRPDHEGTPLVPPYEVEIAESGWVDWDLDPPLLVMPDQHFWPGVRMLEDDGPQMAVGDAVGGGRSMVRSQDMIETWIAQGEQFFKWAGLGDGAELLVEVQGEELCALEEFSFTDVTEAAGLADSGGRIVWGDIDGDGLPDLLGVRADGDGMSRLFRNLGDGTFEDVTEASGVQAVRMALAVFLDANNDGYPDIYFSEYHDGDPPFPEDQPAGILLNDGTGVFTAVEDSGVNVQGPIGGAAAADCDGDGNLDLFVGHWLAHYPSDPRPNHFFLGNGDGTFRDATADVFELPSPSYAAPCYGAIWGDFDNDGDQDLYVANYGGYGNELWLNDGACHLTNVGSRRRVASDRSGQSSGTSFGPAFGDYDNDGDLDLYVANISHPRYQVVGSDHSLLHRNEGAPDYMFTNVTDEAGFVYQEGNIEPSFGDYDCDGDLDLFVSSTYDYEYSRLWRQGDDHGFSDATYPAGILVGGSGDNTWVDFDRDGDLDLIAIKGNAAQVLYRNEIDLAALGRHFLNVRLVGNGTTSNLAAVGARLTVTSASGSRIREVRCGEGHYNSQPPLELHVGLGADAGPVDISIRWPDGTVESHEDVAVDRFYVVEQGGAPAALD